jgi:hypothetical protein
MFHHDALAHWQQQQKAAGAASGMWQEGQQQATQPTLPVVLRGAAHLVSVPCPEVQRILLQLCSDQVVPAQAAEGIPATTVAFVVRQLCTGV